MNSEYDIGGDYVAVGGDGSFMPKSVDDWAKNWATNHYLIALAWMIFGIIMIIYHLYKLATAEKFNPTATMRWNKRDEYGTSENMTNRADSVFSKEVQSNAGVSMSASAQQILNDANINCSGRKESASNAWDWMNGVAHESMENPKDDNGLSKKLAGF